MNQFKSVHWGVSAWTITATAMSGLLAIVLFLVLLISIGTQRQLNAYMDDNLAQSSTLRMVPTVARACKAYWALEQYYPEGRAPSPSSELCDALTDPSQSLADAVAQFASGSNQDSLGASDVF
jgi:hypothetical protein